MKEKIAEIVGCLRKDKKGDCEFCSWPEEQCPSAIQIQAILALIEQEQKPMRAMAGLLKDSAEHSVNAYTKKTKQQIEKQCSKCPHWEGFCMVKKCILEPEPAEMPLISEPRTNSEDYDEGIRHGSRYQRDVDMAWLPTHDQQVAAKAVKEFAEKVIAKVTSLKQPLNYPIDIAYNRAIDAALVLIRAMAEGKE